MSALPGLDAVRDGGPVEAGVASSGRAPLGPWMATALVVGSMIGSGVFLLPATLAPYGARGAEEGIGELVCASPFPSRPVCLFADPEGRRFQDAYFAQNPGYWTHGDVLEITARGTTRIHGRSDGVLNIRGIRIGPAEIYSALVGVEAIAESMAIEQLAPAVEQSALMMHASMMAARPALIYFRPAMLAVVEQVRALRKSGVAACYTMDAGPHVKVLVEPAAVERVRASLSELPGVLRVLASGPGPDARCLSDDEPRP